MKSKSKKQHRRDVSKSRARFEGAVESVTISIRFTPGEDDEVWQALHDYWQKRDGEGERVEGRSGAIKALILAGAEKPAPAPAPDPNAGLLRKIENMLNNLNVGGAAPASAPGPAPTNMPRGLQLDTLENIGGLSDPHNRKGMKR